jgi:integrase
LRHQLIAACPDTLQGKRDRALIAVGYDTLCRRAELVSLRTEDISPLENGAMTILVRRAKNDPFGDGRYGFLAPPTMQLLIDWLDAAGIKDEFLFRRITGRWIGPDALHPYSVNGTLREAAKKAGLDPNVVAGLSGHSMRVGAAQDLVADGLGILPIMQAGGLEVDERHRAIRRTCGNRAMQPDAAFSSSGRTLASTPSG